MSLTTPRPSTQPSHHVLIRYVRLCWAKGYVAPYRNSHGEACILHHTKLEELLDVIMYELSIIVSNNDNNNINSAPLSLCWSISVSGDGRIPLTGGTSGGMHAMVIELDEQLILHSSRALPAPQTMYRRRR